MHGQNIDDARYELATTACAWWVECGGDLASLDNCIYNQLVLMEDPLAQDQCLDRCGAAAWLEIARQKECPQYPDELAADLLSLFGECEP